MEWGLALCTPRHSGSLLLCLLAESPGVLRALIFKKLGVTKNNWKCVLVLLHLFLLTPAPLADPHPGAAAICPTQKRAPPLSQRSFVRGVQDLRCFQMCEMGNLYSTGTRTNIAYVLLVNLLGFLLPCVMTCNSVFYMQVGHFCMHHQSYTVQARVRRSLAVSLLLISVFSKDTFNSLCL